jgi:Fe-S-cluster containining protein
VAHDWLEEADGRFLRALDAAVAEGEARCGGRLDYGRACPACCLGPFPINRLDALRLQRGLAELAAREPARADAIVAAAQDAVRSLAADFPGDGSRGRLVDEVSGRDAFFARFHRRPCPALDLQSGRCQLYAARPLTCRTFGPPVHLGGHDLEACEPCFQGGADAEAACRVPLDADGREDALLDRLEEEEGDQGETIIAYALARPLLKP